ncbi:hypothetical protein RB195_022657 [Necator americanus]|uniref:Reverse transcriptase/retrotransposon-derived protein RNase H-like domain-containing protein n=1 Tax=Necator americanus TaxID=51031 RepID=A0ABR1EG37_NECAM
MGRPKLQLPRLTLKSANKEPINVRECYGYNFVIDGHRGYGIGHLADTPSLLGLDWIAQYEPLFRPLTEDSICNISSSLTQPKPGIFQQCLDALIAGLDGTAAHLDDILVAGRTICEHNARLEAVFKRIQDYGFRVRIDNCASLQTEATYLGFVINAQRRRSDSEKIKVIRKMPAPKDVSQLCSFLRLINFYGNFVKDLHNLRALLDTLTKKDVVHTWTPESSFDKIRAILSSDLPLTHFDPSFPVIVAADDSNYGMGATLSHRFADECEKVIYHASLTQPQKNYSQIEKGVLALIFAVQKFHRFIYVRHFTLNTDQKPLLAFFRSGKGVSVYSANRLQRWATMLLNYSFTIGYINT